MFDLSNSQLDLLSSETLTYWCLIHADMNDKIAVYSNNFNATKIINGFSVKKIFYQKIS